MLLSFDFKYLAKTTDIVYERWDKNQPNKKKNNFDCVQSQKGYWKVLQCGKARHYACEKVLKYENLKE